MHLRKICILLLVLGVLYFSVVSIWFTVLFKSSIFLFIFCLDFLFTIKSGLLKTLLELFPLCRLYVYMCICVSLELLLYAHMFIIVVSPSSVDPFINIQCLHLILVRMAIIKKSLQITNSGKYVVSTHQISATSLPQL